jgi:hypothetical protein
MSTTGKRNRCTVKRATSSSVSLVRIGSDSKLLDSSSSLRKRRLSRGWMSTICASSSITLSIGLVSRDGEISSV